MHIEVYTDGSATTADKPGGYGWVMTLNGQKHSEGSGHMPLASNNDAELQAAIAGLANVYNFILLSSTIAGDSNTPSEGFEVTLVSDSQLILGWASGQFKFRQADKIEKYKELQLLVNNLRAKTRWVEGHTGDEHNERCDTLANEARLGVQRQVEKVEAIKTGKTAIGNKKSGIICVWYKNVLKVIDLEDNIVENYDRKTHGSRGSMLEIREDKNR